MYTPSFDICLGWRERRRTWGAVSAQLQQLVDELAERLRRSVAVDDPDIQLLAASPHRGSIDPARLDVILSRRTGPEVVAYALSMELSHLRTFRRLPGSSELQTLPRVVWPLRDHGELFGYLWLIDSPTVTESDIALTSEAVAEISRLLAAESRAADARSAQDAHVIRQLLGSDELARDEALSGLQRAGRLLPDRALRVAVVSVGAGSSAADGAGSNVSGRLDAEFAVTVVRRVLGQTPSAAVDGELVIVSDDTAWNPRASDTAALRPAWERMRSALVGSGITDVAVGVSPAREPADLAFARQRAHYCAHVAVRLGGFPGVAHWEQMGSWQLLYGLPWTWETVSALHPGLEALLQPERRELAVTLSTYLDCGGDGAATVRALCVHRATFYYRRDRIRALIGSDWEQGWSRVGAHAAMTLAGLLDPGLRAVRGGPETFGET